MALSLPRQNYDLMSRESGGRAAFEYESMVPMKSDTLKRSLTKDRISDEGLDMNCRDKNESDNEPDGEPAAKLRRGGGRRKQSKPMRMFAELDAMPDSDPSQAVSNQMTGNYRGFDEGKVAGFQNLPTSDTAVCRLCHEYFQTDLALKEHMEQVHAMVLREGAVREGHCPTRYHLLGKELIQESDFEPVDKDDDGDMKSIFCGGKDQHEMAEATDEDSCGNSNWTPAKKDEERAISGVDLSKMSDSSHRTMTNSPVEQPPARLFPVVDEPHSLPLPEPNLGAQSKNPHEGNDLRKPVDFGASFQTYEAITQGEAHSQPSAVVPSSWDPAKSRIFHPDAYCEICDREFCNKYFLKTHKANKHGIYDNNITAMEISTSTNNDLFFNMLSQQQQQQQQQPPIATPPKSSPPKQSMDPVGFVSGLPPPPLLSSSCASAENSGSITPIKSSSVDSDECCEICQKHFASRSQLKRHKQEIHGLLQGSDGSKRSNIGGLSAGSPTSNPASASMENLSNSHPLLLPHLPATSGCAMPSALSNFGRMANLNNLMFLNPFNPPLAVIPPLFPTPGLGFRPNALALPQLPLQDVPKGTSNSRFPSDTSPVPSSLLQSMGVLNAEALMELYRKEFCNNYLMRSQEAKNCSGLFTAGMAGFQSAMPTSLANSMPFPLPGKIGSQDPVKVKFEMPAENSEVCEICKKTFVNKQALVSHILSTHHANQDNCDLASELMKLDKLNEDHHFEKTMFNNMVAAKLVDRVQCDICSKEVCNKYFLKTHKIKVHGWDPVSGDREMPEKSVARPPSPPHTVSEPPMPDLMNVEKPKEEELLQMGIDPEAYCEICKKEFCNKYFLKTHKQNIHGIKTNAGQMEIRTNPMETWNFAQVPPPPNPLTATQLSLLAGNQQLQSLAPVLNAPPSLMSMLDSGGQDGSAEKRSWKWKEPVNAMRVTCEICNKVLCNKYFLKTHMMKRHGVNYDTITGQLMTATKSQALSEYAPMRDAKDETRSSDDLLPYQQRVLSPTEKQNPLNMQAVIRHSGISEERSSPDETFEKNDEECVSTPGRMSDRLDRERMSSGEMEHRPSTISLVHSETSRALDLTSAAATVMAKTWQVPSDDNEQDDRMNDNDRMIDNEYHLGNAYLTPSAEATVHRMTTEDGEMAYGEKDSSKMYSSKEGHFDEARGSSATSSPLSSSFEENKTQSCVQNFVGPSKFDGAVAESAKAAIANHIRSQQKKKLFRCTHCRKRFQLRSQCELHIRSAHPRLEGLGHHGDYGSERPENKQSSASNESSSSTNSLGYLNGYASTRLPNFSSDSAERKDPVVPGLDVIAKQPVTYAQPIDPTNLSNILMQPFLLKEVGGENHFAASLVYLPALQKINEPVSVTFSLTPILQH